MFHSIPTRLDDQTRFALVLSRPDKVWVIPIASGMLEYPRVESDPHNLAAFNLTLIARKTPDSETQWTSLAMSYLALIGHGGETSDARVSCVKPECSIQISEHQSPMAVISWTLTSAPTLNSRGWRMYRGKFIRRISRRGGPHNAKVPHSIAFCAIEWGQDAAEIV